MDLSKLPSPFYRVAAKAIVLYNEKHLLVGLLKGPEGKWEIPGGGLEHNETIEETLQREIMEELGVGVVSVGKIQFTYRGRNPRGYMALRLALPVKLDSYDFKFGDLSEAKFVTKEELLELDMAVDEAAVKNCVEYIWPNS